MLEGYGLTESTAAATVNPAEKTKVGTVGKPFPGVSIKLAQDGEILIHGEMIMKGYWNHPEATAEAIVDEGGWLHTGDIGMMDDDGYLTITDRKKDILVLGQRQKMSHRSRLKANCAPQSSSPISCFSAITRARSELWSYQSFQALC